jgi:hypothetical protein
LGARARLGVVAVGVVAVLFILFGIVVIGSAGVVAAEEALITRPLFAEFAGIGLISQGFFFLRIATLRHSITSNNRADVISKRRLAVETREYPNLREALSDGISAADDALTPIDTLPTMAFAVHDRPLTRDSL